MKGIVFTELLDMVEAKFGIEMVDGMISDANLPHGGAYTSVGSYPHDEIVALAVSLSTRSGIRLPDLLRIFGKHLFGRFYALYPHLMDTSPNALTFLLGIESVVHSEVRKLYPDAQLPTFETKRLAADRILMHYSSRHDFSELAYGLIEGCAEHYGVALDVQRTPAQEKNGLQWVDFDIRHA